MNTYFLADRGTTGAVDPNGIANIWTRLQPLPCVVTDAMLPTAAAGNSGGCAVPFAGAEIAIQLTVGVSTANGHPHNAFTPNAAGNVRRAGHLAVDDRQRIASGWLAAAGLGQNGHVPQPVIRHLRERRLDHASGYNSAKNNYPSQRHFRLQSCFYLAARSDQASFVNQRSGFAAVQTMRVEPGPNLLRTISSDSQEFEPVCLCRHGRLARRHLRREAWQNNNRRAQQAQYC